MGAPIRLSDKAVVTHVMVVVKDGDQGGQVAMPLAEFARLFVTGRRTHGLRERGMADCAEEVEVKLFRIESQSAAESSSMTLAGPWTIIGEADTRMEANDVERAEFARGWRNTRTVANLDLVEALRVECERLRADLDFYRKLADGKVPT